MDNEKLKSYGIQFLIWGWIPLGLISESFLGISLVFSGLWALAVMVVYLYALTMDKISTNNSSKKWEELTKDLFDRDVDYVFFKQK